MYFLQRLVVTALFFCHSLCLMAMVDSYHQHANDWPGFGIVAAAFAFVAVAIIWAHGNKDM